MFFSKLRSLFIFCYWEQICNLCVPPVSTLEEKQIVEEKTSFSLFIDSVLDEKRVNVIKVIRQLTSLDLKASKSIIESLPHLVLENLSKEEAENGKKLLDEAGAVCRLV